MPDCPPHGRAAVRHGGGHGARLKRRFVPPGEGEVGGWCERWRVTGLFADSRGGSTAYIASVRSPPLLRHLGWWLGPTHPQSAPPPGEGRVSTVKSGGYARVRVFLRHHIWRFTLAPSRYSVETYMDASGSGSILFWVCFAAWMYSNYCETGSIWP